MQKCSAFERKGMLTGPQATKKIIATVLLLVLVLVIGIFYKNNTFAIEKFKETPVAESSLLENEKNTIEIFKKLSPMVVFVHNLAYVSDFFAFNVTEVQRGTGSGFVWDNSAT